jgi:hypothetical protein
MAADRRQPARDRLGERAAHCRRETIRRFADGEPLLGLIDRRAGY